MAENIFFTTEKTLARFLLDIGRTAKTYRKPFISNK